MQLRDFIFLFFFFFLGNFSSFGQVFNNENTPKNRVKIDSLLELVGESSVFEKDALEALNLSKKIDYKIGQAKALNKLSLIYSFQEKNFIALEYLENAKEIVNVHGTKADQLEILSSFTSTYRQFNYYIEAFDYGDQTIDLAKQLQDSVVMANAIWDIARVHFKLKQFDKYRELTNQVISIYGEMDRMDGIAKVYIHYSGIMTETDSVIFYLEKANSLLPQIKDSHNRKKIELWLYSRFAHIYNSINNYPKTEIFVKKGLPIAKELYNNNLVAILKSYLARVQFYHYKNYPKAIELAERYLQYEKSIRRYYYVIPQAQFLSEIHTKTNQLDKALEFANLAILYQDSLYWANRKNDVEEIEKANDLKQRLNEIHLLESQRRTRTILGGASLVFLLILIAFFYQKQQQKSKLLKIQKEFSERLLQEQKTIEQQREQLEGLNKTKDKLLAMIGHDLRSPLFSLQGLDEQINYLLETGQMERIKELSTSMEKTTKYLNDTLNNLLNWALTQMDKFPYQPEQVNLKEISQNVFSLFEKNAKEKRIELKLEVEKNLNAFVDKNAMNSILRNLVSNAIKFTDLEGEIKIRANQNNGTVSLIVSDTGEGISEEQIQNIVSGNFSKGEQGTQGEKSTGLGWNLINDLVKQNHGRFQIDSNKGQGTSVVICLPTK